MPPLKPARYHLERIRDRWTVKIDGAHWEFDSQAKALQWAIDEAQATGRRGREASVVVPSAATDWQAVWTYGKDRYPPKG